MLRKNYSYTVSEFFYDKSFIDYDQNSYVLTYNQNLGNDLYCPSKIILSERLFVIPYSPKIITNEFSLDFSLHDAIGTFDAAKDHIGVFGKHQFINTDLGNRLKDMFGEDGLYTLAPIGNVIFDQDNNAIEYILQALYFKYKI